MAEEKNEPEVPKEPGSQEVVDAVNNLASVVKDVGVRPVRDFFKRLTDLAESFLAPIEEGPKKKKK